MTVSAFMTKNPVTLRADDTIGRAAEIMLKNRYLILPVIDADGRYTGVFDMWDLLALLLPKGAVVDHLPGLGFLADDLPALQQKLKGMSEQKVGPLARPDLPMLRPDTSPVEALLLFYRNRSTLPVVEEPSGKLVGVLSYWDVLGAISGKSA